MDNWVATVVMLVAAARVEEAAIHASKISGRVEDATPAFFSREVGVAGLVLYRLACTRVRKRTLDALPSLAAYYAGDAFFFVIEHDEDEGQIEYGSVGEVLDALGLKFMDQEEVDDV